MGNSIGSCTKQQTKASKSMTSKNNTKEPKPQRAKKQKKKQTSKNKKNSETTKGTNSIQKTNDATTTKIKNGGQGNSVKPKKIKEVKTEQILKTEVKEEEIHRKESPVDTVNINISEKIPEKKVAEKDVLDEDTPGKNDAGNASDLGDVLNFIESVNVDSKRSEDTVESSGNAKRNDNEGSESASDETELLKKRCSQLEADIEFATNQAKEEKIRLLEEERRQRDSLVNDNVLLRNKINDLQKKIASQEEMIAKHNTEISRLRELSSSYGTLNEVIEQEMAYLEEQVIKLKKENNHLRESLDKNNKSDVEICKD